VHGASGTRRGLIDSSAARSISAPAPGPDPVGAFDARNRRSLDEAECPACGYNLRGAVGDVVACPECGASVDLAKLVTARWRGPWYRAPGLNRVHTPLAIAAGTALVSLLLTFGAVGWDLTPGWLTPIVAAGGGVAWLAVMWRVGTWWPGWVGPALSLLSHVIFVLLLGGVLMLLVAGINVVMLVGDVGGVARVVWLAVAMVSAVGLILFGRWLERVQAERCIRRSLRRAAVASAAPGDGD